ncbi:MAG: GTPase ObgE [Planctomycetota bacterium]|nr:GTPase ObgE [Planctomycetota bacterium]
MFLDEYECTMVGGVGGQGCCSFRREKYVPRGGPDGGDGGRGGSVVLMPTIHRNTLYHLGGSRVYSADKGQQGGSSDCFGRKGDDLILEVPVGTVVLDAGHGNVLRDLDQPDEPFVVARGGKGGRGNARFKTATNRVPRTWEPGGPGEERAVRLSLKLIADVGLVGLPNAGKSTLVSTLSKARPKIADYPFTTLEPHLGIVEGRGDATFVMADIPGLIEGAHQGKGLGDKFLRHVERTRALLHLVDVSDAAEAEPVESYRVIHRELAGYSADLAARPTLLVATKVEDQAGLDRAKAFQVAAGQRVYPISAATNRGLGRLIDAITSLLRERSD